MWWHMAINKQMIPCASNLIKLGVVGVNVSCTSYSSLCNNPVSFCNLYNLSPLNNCNSLLWVLNLFVFPLSWCRKPSAPFPGCQLDKGSTVLCLMEVALAECPALLFWAATLPGRASGGWAHAVAFYLAWIIIWCLFKWELSARLTVRQSFKNCSMLWDLLGSGHQEQAVAVCCEGLCEHVCFLKRSAWTFEDACFQISALIILSLPQSMSNRYYHKFLMAVLRGHACCWRLKPSCGTKSVGAGECSGCGTRG